MFAERFEKVIDFKLTVVSLSVDYCFIVIIMFVNDYGRLDRHKKR